MPTDYLAEPLTGGPFTLAEGPVWHPSRERIHWVDIEGKQVFEGIPEKDAVVVTATHTFDARVSAVVYADDGRLLVAEETRLTVIERDGRRTPGPDIIVDGRRSRTNDGAVDPAGRFLIGTMTLDGTPQHEVLARVEDDRTVTVLDDDLSISNGLAWTADGSTLFSVDSRSRTIYRRAYDPLGLAVGPREVAITIPDGVPDGLCLDVDGNLWVAIWGAGEIRCLTPTGDLLATVSVRAPHTSSVAFCGPSLDRLLITTARADLSADQLRAFPDSGRLFAVSVDTTGLPTTPWSGSWAKA